MNKAVPWNVNGVGFDAREAAREAARRQGKSLGEWLHGVIADHAADLGVQEHEIAGQQRIDAVTSKLERLSARSADHDRRAQHPRGTDFTRRRPSRDRDDDLDRDEQPRTARSSDDRYSGESAPRRQRPPVEATELLLEEAIDAMERRALRAERHTDDALQSFSKLLERNEAHRDRERDSVAALAQKLSDIETRLTDRLGQSDDNPIKGALARLESRLDTISRRSAAEMAAHQQASLPVPAAPVAPPEPFDRLEEKLNSILAAVHAQPPLPATEAAPISAAPAYKPEDYQAPQRDRLGEAIAAIGKRQRTLETSETASVSLKQAVLRRRGALPPAGATNIAPTNLRPAAPAPVPAQNFRVGAPRSNEPAPFVAMQNEISVLAATIETLRSDVLRQRQSGPDPIDIDTLRSEIATMSGTLRDLAPRSGLSSLEASIRALTDRIEASRDNGLRETALRPVETVVGDLRRALGNIDPRRSIIGLEDDLSEIGVKIGDLSHAGVAPASIARITDQMQEIRDLIAATVARPLGVERIEQQIAALNERLDRQTRHPGINQNLGAAADDLRAMIANPQDTGAFTKIENRLESLSAKIDQTVETARDEAAQPRGPSPSELGTLETLVRDLGHKMEAVQAPDAGHQAFDALQQQISLLSARFERSDDGLAKLTSLERSMKDLFAHLEETRTTVESSAARAAREVLRIAMEEGRAQTDQGAAASLATMHALQEAAEARTASTLKAVHGTLEKVVDRLSVMEADIVDTRKRSTGRESDLRASASDLRASEMRAPELRAPLGASHLGTGRAGMDDPVLDKGLGKPSKTPAPSIRLEVEDENGRADFIAAARRAAKVAQADPSVAEMNRSGASRGVSAVREGLIEQTRDYVTRHKRPVLLSIAALFVVLGTMAIIQRIGFDESEPQIAETAAPARVASLVAPAPIVRAVRHNDELTPSALPISAPPLANQIPGSDPIQTGSIPSLPAFAANGTPRRPQLSASLKSKADAGDGAAAYVLGAQYAEGSVVPRDFARAAQWYQKAAAQNLAPAQYRLASLYEKGLGVVQDKGKAKTLYLQAAEAGNPRAMHNLAVLLADGDGKPDYDGAATWFRKAAQYGIHDSQYNLAILLARGIGVQQSLVQSYQWFAIASAQGDADAAKKRDEVGSKLGANDLAVAKALAASFRPRVADIVATEVTPPGA